MLAFAVSGKSGAGQTVTGANMAYRCALRGMDVVYVDFDFDSPTAAVVFGLSELMDGAPSSGLHSYLTGTAAAPVQHDVWTATDRRDLRLRPDGSGRLTLFPGDSRGAEFEVRRDTVNRCVELFVRLNEEFDVAIVDLTAGRSAAIDLALQATAAPALRGAVCRWLVVHRWTYQHLIAAGGLVHRQHGLIDAAVKAGHLESEFRESLRFVRVAVVGPSSPLLAGISAIQASWLQACDRELQELSSRLNMGASLVLGSTPLDPVLQAREQLILDIDVGVLRICGVETALAFEHLASCLTDGTAWIVP